MLKRMLWSALPLAVVLTVLVARADAAPQRKILIKDNCDPTTFDQALGPGACVGHGSVTFQQFIAELQRLQRAPQWHFVPDHVHLTVDEPFTATNVGGENHTFTEVDAFGGGFVPQLNQLAGNLTPRPECAQTVNGHLAPAPPAQASLLHPGQSLNDSEEEPGTHLYQCCIHPWMHAVLSVQERGGT